MPKNKLTYETLLKELSNIKKLTYKSIESLLLKLNKVIDDLGIQRMELLEATMDQPNEPPDQDLNQLKSKQQHLIRIRDHLYQTLQGLQEMPKKGHKSNTNFMQDICKSYTTDNGIIGTWSI